MEGPTPKKGRAPSVSFSLVTLDPNNPPAPPAQPRPIIGRRAKLLRHSLFTVATLGTATIAESVAASGHPRDVIGPRFSELRTLGYIERTGERRVNPVTGKTGAVLRLTALGKEALA